MTADVSASGSRPGAERRHNLDQCLCCGYYSVERRSWTFGVSGTQCPVCGWISDFNQEHDDHLRHGRNPVSLTEARSAYVAAGAVHPGVRRLVRLPQPEDADPRRGEGRGQ